MHGIFRFYICTSIAEIRSLVLLHMITPCIYVIMSILDAVQVGSLLFGT